MSRTKKNVATALGLIVVAGLLWLTTRLLVPGPRDDDAAVTRKRAYLGRLAELTGGAPAGPSFVVILFDDLGHGDLGCYGSAIRTPHLDRLAAAGARFTAAYATSPYCSASRMGLLTGRYPARAGLDHVVQAPWTWKDLLVRFGGLPRRLALEELTAAEILQAAGWATALIGKWHLGDVSPSLPLERGFDRFYGLLHSNDQGEPAVRRGNEIVEHHPIDQAALSRRYGEEAADFIAASHGRPFFLYLAHTFPHVPLHAPPERVGSSPAGLYGDVVEELDRSVGRVLEALAANGRADDTLVIVTSDNGPWFQGSPGGLRGRKFDVFEGGMRVPFLAAWPGRIESGRVVDEPVMGIDLLPTLLELAGLPPPPDRVLDGVSLASLLEVGTPPPREALYFFQLGELKAVRAGRFKYHAPRHVLFGNMMDWSWAPMRRVGPWLFDLERDPDESYDVSRRHPDVARRLRALLESQRERLARDPKGWREP